jgi:hypothetical protein
VLIFIPGVGISSANWVYFAAPKSSFIMIGWSQSPPSPKGDDANGYI